MKWNKKFAYSFKDVFAYCLKDKYLLTFPFSNDSILKPADVFQYFGMYFSTTAIPSTYVYEKNTDLFNLFCFRYWNEYIMESEELKEDSYEDPAAYPDIMAKAKDFLSKFMHILLITYPKYKTLLDVYTNTQTNLMGKLQRIIDGDMTHTGTEHLGIGDSVTNIRKDNDTPQGSGDFSDDTHTSFVSTDSSTTSGNHLTSRNLTDTNDVTESWDNEATIERLKKIKDLYAKTMEDWLDEFGILFVDGGNYQ